MLNPAKWKQKQIKTNSLIILFEFLSVPVLLEKHFEIEANLSKEEMKKINEDIQNETNEKYVILEVFVFYRTIVFFRNTIH